MELTGKAWCETVLREMKAAYIDLTLKNRLTKDLEQATALINTLNLKYDIDTPNVSLSKQSPKPPYTVT